MEGKTINGFELKRKLGVGDMAEVWYAENSIGKKAAVKILLQKHCSNDDVTARFQTEARVMVNLNNPYIRQVYDYGEIDGRPTIVMEYLEGEDLKTLINKGQVFEKDELVRWWNQLVDALKYTHAKGIIHRDIKPGNIFVEDSGNIKLLDFSISKMRDSVSAMKTSQKLGTLIYMSPEQVKDSKNIDYQTDYYSLAITFVHLISGKKPYDNDTSSDFEISEQIVYKPVDMTDIPDDWKYFLLPYLEKEPAKRPELRYFEKVAPTKPEDNKTIVVGGAVEQPKQPEPPVKKKDTTKKKKGKAWIWIILVLILIAAAAVALLFFEVIPNPLKSQKENDAFEACRDVSDYREYLELYGTEALHYAEAMEFIDNYIADSIEQAEQAKAAAEAEEKANKAEANKKAREAKAAKKAYMDINKVLFINTEDSRFLSHDDEPLYADDMKNLAIVIKYKGLPEAMKTVSLDFKILKPNGELLGDVENVYSFSKLVTVEPGANKTVEIGEWDNGDRVLNNAGTWGFEIWYKENKIYNTTFEILDKNNTYIAPTKSDNTLSLGKWKALFKKCTENVTEKYGADVYKGEVDGNNNRSGYGMYGWSSGSYYVGSWQNDKRNGFGLFICMPGKEMADCPGCVYYAGGWSSSNPSGTGFCFDKYGDLIYAGNFENGVPTEQYPSVSFSGNLKFICNEKDDMYYLGLANNGEPFSFGMYLFKKGDLLYGASSNGEMLGELCLMKYDGSVQRTTWNEVMGK